MSTAAIDPRAFCEALYGALTRWDAFSVASDHRIAFTAVAVDNGQRKFYRVEFDEVRDFQWREDDEALRGDVPPRRHAEDRLELSDIELEREPRGWRFWCDPWYVHAVEFRCTTIRLNGAELVGTGRWLQDDLPVAEPLVPPYPGVPPTSVEEVLDVPGTS